MFVLNEKIILLIFLADFKNKFCQLNSLKLLFTKNKFLKLKK
jgi:hypothetical protein